MQSEISRLENMSKDSLRNIVFDLHLADILSMCETSSILREKVCNDMQMWRNLVNRDFPLSPNIPELNPKTLYTLNYRQQTVYTVIKNGDGKGFHTVAEYRSGIAHSSMILEIKGLRPISGTEIVIAVMDLFDIRIGLDIIGYAPSVEDFLNQIRNKNSLFYDILFDNTESERLEYEGDFDQELIRYFREYGFVESDEYRISLETIILQ